MLLVTWSLYFWKSKMPECWLPFLTFKLYYFTLFHDSSTLNTYKWKLNDCKLVLAIRKVTTVTILMKNVFYKMAATGHQTTGSLYHVNQSICILLFDFNNTCNVQTAMSTKSFVWDLEINVKICCNWNDKADLTVSLLHWSSGNRSKKI